MRRCGLITQVTASFSAMVATLNSVNEPNFRFYFREPVLESGIGYFKHESPPTAITID